ncbi:MAG: amino acid adenylation domain-containing protein [Nostocaceae cyanobacterium]|nr:amino acid adenylation domain-containing protein [Nostocaceae cyanobacterium]
MNIVEFLEHLGTKNIELWVEGEKLRYRAPQEVLSPTILSEIKQYKTEILAFLRRKNDSILPTNRDVALPLSFAQQRLWIITQLDPDNAFYNLPGAVRLQGKLNIEFLQQSFSEIINRHEALRTNFIVQADGEPVQIIRPPGAWKLSVVDIQKLSPREQEISWQKLAAKSAQRPFNLATEPLIRGTLVQLSDTEHILLLCLHHIIADGWSKSIFVRELATFYSSFYHGRTVPLPQLPIQYADYAVWQRQWLQGDILESQLEYWKQQLANAPTLLSLPTDRPRPAVQTFQGGYQSFAFPKQLSEALKSLSREEGVTLFMTLLCAFNILLYRYAGTEDILVGSPIANRNKSEIEGLIGFFVNNLVLRTDLSGNPSYRELLARVKEITLAAYNHQDIPFELLVDALVPERDLSHTPLFQVMFALQNTPVEKMDLAGLSLSPLVVENKTSKFDLTLSVENTTDGLTGWWEYSTDLFDDATITRMIGHFQTLLEGIVANPQQNIDELPLLTANERHQLLVEWNDTARKYPSDKSIHQLFEEQVEKTPDAIALVYEDKQLSYQELNRRANQLAHYLQTLGVGPDVLVGICVERSPEMIVGLLGILKAGGAYVPLDPDYPPERLSLMLSDAEVGVLLTQQRLVKELPNHSATVVCLDQIWEEISQQSEKNLVNGVTPDNLAYINYTSGSTGQPKGVEVVHRGVVRLLMGVDYVHLDATGRFLQLSSISFDASTLEIWGALLHGGQCILFPGRVPTPLELSQQIHKHGITIMWLTSALFNTIIDHTPEALSGIKQLLIGGEALSVVHVHKGLQVLPDTEIINGYGPTESTTFTCCYSIQRTLDPLVQSIPIGRPISNTQVYILDTQMQPVPMGVPGELYIAGAGLARGYLNHPELSNEKFVPNPFDSGEGGRLYRTGDLVRYLDNGCIEYLGRIDNQVKIRGFRIELGEIETVLSQHPGVGQTVAIVREDVAGDKRLVVYVVSDEQQTPTSADLHSFLKHKLPGYMLPSAIVFLPDLPLTANGKIDRKALPAPDFHRELTASFVAPRNEVEQTLAQIWAEVLRVESVGVADNFFELGGDSILGLQTIARANQKGIFLTPKQLFEHQTIGELAAVAGTTQGVTAQQGLVTGSLPLTPIQHWFFEQNQPEKAHFNQSVLLEVPSDFNPELLSAVLKELLRHHDALRLRFEQQGEQWSQSNAGDGETVPLKVVDLSGKREQGIGNREQGTGNGEQGIGNREQGIGNSGEDYWKRSIEAIGNELQESLNLSTGPLMQAALFYLGAGQPSRLLLIIHHLAVDGVSWRILLTDLFNAYQQISNGEAIQLPPKTSSFRDWSGRLTEYAQSTALKTELDYWVDHGKGEYTPLPRDKNATDAANTVGASAQISVSLSLEETRALLQSVPSAYNTQINDVLLTALVQTFAQWTGKSSLLIDLEGHGREQLFTDIDLSRTVGWFTSIFPMELQYQQGNHPGVALKSIKEQLRRLPQRGIGYGILCYLSEGEIRQQLQTLPTPEVSFNYLGQFNQELLPSSIAKLAKESPGRVQNSLQHRQHLLELDGMIVDGQLQINWTYSQNFHHRETIISLAQELITNLQTLIAHCLSPEAGGYTPSDFPLAKLNQEQLEQILAHLQTGNNKTHWRNITNIYPLSPMQEGILFHSLYTPQSGAYFEQFVCTLQGNLDLQAFEQAWLQVVTRHSVLRTAFLWGVSDQSLQIVYRQVPVSLKILDWRSLPPSKQQEQLQTFLEQQRKQNLPLDQAPMMNLTLIQMSDDLYEFVWGHHHLLLDGWSLSLVVKEVFSLYHGYLRGEEQNLPLKPAQPYAHYIEWLQNQDIKAAELYWQEKLQGFTAPTPLTFKKPSFNQDQQPTRNNLHEISLTKEAIANLESFARQQQLTVNTLIQGAWALLLSHYSRESDVVFGVTVSGRPPAMVGVESMVGLFINTLPIRVQISETVEVLPWLRSLQTQQVESEEYSYSFLVDIQKWSEIPQGMPLFESLVVFENYPVDTSLLGENSGLAISNVGVIEQTNYPLTLLVNTGWEMFLKLSYDPNRFDSATITQIGEHFQTILSGIVANPQQHLLEVPMLTATEREQLLFAWNPTQDSYPQEQLLHQLFEEQVSRTPDAVAVVFADQQLTYHELNCRANQLANYLRKLGVSTGSLVGICVERSLETVVGIMGILKAGGAYVPMDPDYPQERLAYLLSDVQASVLLTQQRLLSKLPEHQAEVVCLDTEWSVIAEQKETLLELDNLASQRPAYVIYTSGSTGLPKGCVVTHTNVVRLLKATQQWYEFNCNDVWLLFHSYAFDVSVWELWGALLYGGKIIVVPYWTHRSPAELLKLLESEKVTVLNQTPSVFKQLLQAHEEYSGELYLRYVIFAGEALELQSLKPWFNRYGDQKTKMINMYGITEITVHATYRQICEGDLIMNRGSVIGEPIPDLSLYILDERLEPVPIGVPGEIYVGGMGVTCGYFNRPQLTAGRFIPDPFSKIPGSRLYRSGDLARRLGDGELEYLGRLDHQIKIRGFRIELGEIESALIEHPQVKIGAVINQTTANGEPCIVAYFVSEQKENLIPILRDYLKTILPDYMIPAAFVPIDSLPLTTNGKLNRAALPKLNWEQTQKPYIAPRNEWETTVCSLMASLLGLEKVGINDDFWEIGGNSLLITQLVTHLQRIYQVKLPLAEVFSRRTPSDLAILIQESSEKPSISKIKRVSRKKHSVNLSNDGTIQL